MSELWTPLNEEPHEKFVERLNQAIASFAESTGVETPLVEIELVDTARFVLDRIEPQPGFGMITLYVHAPSDEDGPDAIVIPIGTIRRIELRGSPDDKVARFGFSVAPTSKHPR